MLICEFAIMKGGWHQGGKEMPGLKVVLQQALCEGLWLKGALLTNCICQMNIGIHPLIGDEG